jgi:hypothetical protein
MVHLCMKREGMVASKIMAGLMAGGKGPKFARQGERWPHGRKE